jgi:hypothetical protein
LSDSAVSGFLFRDGDYLNHAYADTLLALIAQLASVTQLTFFLLVEFLQENGFGIIGVSNGAVANGGLQKLAE